MEQPPKDPRNTNEALIKEEEKLRLELLATERSQQEKITKKKEREEELKAQQKKKEELEEKYQKEHGKKVVAQKPAAPTDDSSTKSEKAQKEKKSSKEKNEHKDINDLFSDDFNIKADQVPLLKDLSVSQKKLVYNNLSQIKLDYVKKEALRLYNERMQEAGMMGRVFNSLRKEYLIEGYKKTAKANLDKGGLEVYGKQLQAITDSIKKTGLEISQDDQMSDGFRIEYASGFENLSKEEKERIEEFNRMATEYGEIPKEWSFEAGKLEKAFTGDFGSLRNKDRYEQTKKSYEKAQDELEAFLESKWGNDKEKIFKYLRAIDNNVLFNQMISTDPDALQALNDIDKNSNKWLAGIGKDASGERTIFAAGGFLARMGAKTLDMASVAALPIAFVLGGLRGALRKSKEIREKEVLARRGERSVADVSKGILAKFRSVDEQRKFEIKENTINQSGKIEQGKAITSGETNISLTERLHALTIKMLTLDQAMKNLEAREVEEKNPEALVKIKNEKKELEKSRLISLSTLQSRITFVQNKVDKGEIDYGKNEVRIINQHRILSALNEAYGVASMQTILLDNKERKELEGRFERMYQTSEISRKAKSKMLLWGGIKGATFGAIAAGIGIGARELYTTLHEAGVGAHEMLEESAKIKDLGPKVGDGSIDHPWRGMIDRPEYHGPGIETHSSGGGADQIEKVIPREPGAPGIPDTLTEDGFSHGIRENFSFELGKNGVPGQLERVFNEISLDHMELGHTPILNEEAATKSLNVAANLVKLAEGHNVLGVSADHCGFEYDSAKGILKITNHAEFNKNLEILEKHSNILWKSGGLKGALGEIDNIKPGTWLHIAHADGLDKVHDIASGQEVSTGIVGHDNLDQNNITNFQKSDLVEKAHQIHHADLKDPYANLKPESLDHPGSSSGSADDYSDLKAEPLDRNGSDDAYAKLKPEPLDTQKTNPVYKNPTTQTSPRSSESVNGKNPPQEIPDDQGGATTKPKIEEKVSVPKEKVANIPSLEVQNKNIITKILETDNLDESKFWARAQKLPVADVFKQSEDYIKNTATDEHYKSLWAYAKILARESRVAILENEQLGGYLKRAGKIFIENDNSHSLEKVFNDSQTYLKNIQG